MKRRKIVVRIDFSWNGTAFIDSRLERIIMKDVLIYIHGKGGSAAEAEHYKPLLPEEEVIGFDYRAFTSWEAREEFRFFP